jgi:hypothetical protein
MKHQPFVKQATPDGSFIWASIFAPLPDLDDAMTAILNFDQWIGLREAAGLAHPSIDEYIVVRVEDAKVYLNKAPSEDLIGFEGSAHDVRDLFNRMNNDD